MRWQCRHCGYKAESETSCCYAHWEEAANARMSSFWFVGSALIVAVVIVGAIAWATS